MWQLSPKAGKGQTARYIEAVRLLRLRRLLRAVPKEQRTQYRAYVDSVVHTLGKRRLARVVWPWQARPTSPKDDPSVRVFRGRLSNPTALRGV